MTVDPPQGAQDSPQGASLVQRPLLFFLASRASSRFASQIGAVAIGWQIYDLTKSAGMLGLVGLVQFVPTLLLVFVAGHAADRFERKRVMQLCQLVEVATALVLAEACWSGAIGEAQIFAATFVLGMAASFESPATAALLPLVVERPMLQRASALSSGVAEFATITGPALGGFAYAVTPSLAYGAMALFWLSGMVFTGLVWAAPQEVTKPDASDDVFAGVRFIRSHPIILGTISLDLFAVLFGGVTALLPIYARDILLAGPIGLGILRAAPAIGALAMTVVLARRAISEKLGLRMFQAVITFGIATVVFACSRWMWLSLVALAVLGAADTISVVIRYSLVQLSTPDAMRGRVGAVNFLFINASNQLGQFESGVTAALLGTVPAALLGGVATIVVAGLWMRLFPALARVERLE